MKWNSTLMKVRPFMQGLPGGYCPIGTLMKVRPYMEGPFMPGGFWPIRDVNCPQVKEVANFAVAEHNKRSGDNLKLEKVIGGHSQVVAGTNYSLILATHDGSTSQTHKAHVFKPLPCKKEPTKLRLFEPC